MTAAERLVSYVAKLMAIAVGVLTAVIMVIVVIDVAWRSVVGRSIQNADQISILLLVALIFLGLAGAQAQRQNFSVEIFVGTLGPKPRSVLEIVSALIAAGVCLIMAYFSWGSAIESTLNGEMTYGVSYFPVWPTRIIIAVGYSMLFLQFLVQIGGSMLRLSGHVPSGEDTATTHTVL